MAERSQQDSCWLQPAAAAGDSKPTLPVSAGMFRQKTPETSPAVAAGNTAAGNVAAAAADPKYCWALSS
jgi:hypothetical protein